MSETELPPPPTVAGISLDGAQAFVISAEQNAALCRSTGVEAAIDGTAHPIYSYIATQRAMGMTVDQLCAVCEFDVADGPMMVGTSLHFSAPLKVGTPYRVTGEIVSLLRKRSRKLGVMDLLEYKLRMHDAAAVVLEATNSWVLPRKELK